MDDLRKLQGDSGFCKVLRRIEQKGMKRRERRELDRRWRKEQSRAVPSSSSVFRYLAAFHDAAGGPGGDPHPLLTPSGGLPARHPRGPIQPRRQTDVPVIPAAGVTNRCQKPSGGGPS